MLKKIIQPLFLIIYLTIITPAFADTPAQRSTGCELCQVQKQVIDDVAKMLSYIGVHGKEKAIIRVRKSIVEYRAKRVPRDMFAMITRGPLKGWPVDKDIRRALKGQPVDDDDINVIVPKDSKCGGQRDFRYVDAVLKIAQKGGGWTSYYWTNPVTCKKQKFVI